MPGLATLIGEKSLWPDAVASALLAILSMDTFSGVALKPSAAEPKTSDAIIIVKGLLKLFFKLEVFFDFMVHLVGDSSAFALRVI